MTLRHHYQPVDLPAALRAALEPFGRVPEDLTPAELAAVTEFHVGGLGATRRLARHAAPGPGDHVLDLGSGLGGPSRHLARHHGCRVTGLDLTPAYCAAAATFARWQGLDGQCRYVAGDGCAPPFADAAFDLVWTQHTAMNIPDKTGLYAGIARVLRPGGRLALYDIVAAADAPPDLPVPWARLPGHSHLATPAGLRRAVEAAGMAITHWADRTRAGLDWYAEQSAAARAGAAEGRSPPGFNLVLGDAFPTMARNVRRALSDGRLALVEAVARRP